MATQMKWFLFRLKRQCPEFCFSFFPIERSRPGPWLTPPKSSILVRFHKEPALFIQVVSCQTLQLQNPPPVNINRCHLGEKIWESEEKGENGEKRKKGERKWEKVNYKCKINVNREELRQKGHDGSLKTMCPERGGGCSGTVFRDVVIAVRFW